MKTRKEKLQEKRRVRQRKGWEHAVKDAGWCSDDSGNSNEMGGWKWSAQDWEETKGDSSSWGGSTWKTGSWCSDPSKNYYEMEGGKWSEQAWEETTGDSSSWGGSTWESGGWGEPWKGPEGDTSGPQSGSNEATSKSAFEVSDDEMAAQEPAMPAQLPKQMSWTDARLGVLGLLERRQKRLESCLSQRDPPLLCKDECLEIADMLTLRVKDMLLQPPYTQVDPDVMAKIQKLLHPCVDVLQPQRQATIPNTEVTLRNMFQLAIAAIRENKLEVSEPEGAASSGSSILGDGQKPEMGKVVAKKLCSEMAKNHGYNLIAYKDEAGQTRIAKVFARSPGDLWSVDDLVWFIPSHMHDWTLTASAVWSRKEGDKEL